MPQPNIVFQKGQGGLQRPAPGQDYISGLVFYNGTLPSGFTTSNNIKQFFQPSDAVAAGILNDFSDAVAAIAQYNITAAGSAGDKIIISVKDMDNNGNAQTTILSSYKRQSSDTTIPILGGSLVSSINDGTLIHGYSASFDSGTDVLSITAPKKFGIFLNTGSPLVVAITGTITGTPSQFTGGTFSQFAFYYYHILQFFKKNSTANVYVGFFPVPGSYDYHEIGTLQDFSVGSIRQVGVYKDFASAYSEGDHTLIHNACVASDVRHKPISAIYAADMTSVSDISTLQDLSLLSANKSMSCISQDAGGNGNFLFKSIGKSITALGAQLGIASLAKVSESIAWVGKFNISDGNEFEIVGFANGQLLSSPAISDSLLDTLTDRRYVFLKKFVGISGSYFNDSSCAVAVTSDYAYLENNRTIDKAIRGIYSSLLPSLNGPLTLNANGTLAETTIAYLETQAGTNLDQMIRDGEVSAQEVTIDPNQNVLSTSKIIIAVQLVINGVARQILVPIGFTPKIS